MTTHNNQIEVLEYNFPLKEIIELNTCFYLIPVQMENNQR